MAFLRLAPIASRAARLTAVCLVVTGVGCSHRRQSMRPVYVGPAVPAASAPSTVIVDEPATTTTTPPCAGPDCDPKLEPNAGSLDSNVTPSRAGSPPAAAAPDEPGLQMPSNRSGDRVPKSNISPPPELNGPAASLSPATGRRASASRSRVASLQEKVRPFVNDPDDLFQPPKADRPWKFIVVHHSAQAEGSYEQIDREHRKIQGWDGCGYHFVIGNGTGSPDGQIEVARRWSNQKHGLHCKSATNPDVNEYGIGICLIGNFDDAPPSAKQIAATKALVAYLEERYKVPSGSVGTHGEMAGVASACPGKNFPEEQIFGAKHLVSK
jgi:hypothetical protein